MESTQKKKAKLTRRARRVRGKVSGSASRPRLRVVRSNKHIYAQLINDEAGTTLASASSLEEQFRTAAAGAAHHAQPATGANVAGATIVGELVGKRAADAGIKEVVFDRGGNLYHGRVQALADGARSAGLKF